MNRSACVERNLSSIADAALTHASVANLFSWKLRPLHAFHLRTAIAILRDVPTLFEYFSPAYLGEWKPVSKPASISWLVFYSLFLLYAALSASNFLLIDFANLAIHEAGHPLFSPFGYTMTILGGTLAELIAPFVCLSYFFFKRETAGVAFCAFWFFENFLYIGTYMADARTLALPLVGSGDHDWEILFTQWNLMLHDVQIGHTTRFLGWLGMIGTMAWLAWHTLQSAKSEQP